MPENDVTFLAFGQDHRNGQWLKDLTQKIIEMHGAGIPVTLCTEHGPDATTASELETVTKKAAITSYFQSCHDQNTQPDVNEFVRLNHGKLNDGISRNLFRTGEAAWRGPGGWAGSEFAGRAAANEAEVRLMTFAADRGIRVCGLDHPDKERVYRKSGGDDRSEFQRIDYMSGAALEIARGMAQKGGGVIIAVNMGASHVGNLQVSLMEKVQEARSHGELHGAEVHVRCSVALDAPGTLNSLIGTTPQEGQHTMLSGAERIHRYANAPEQSEGLMEYREMAARNDVQGLNDRLGPKRREAEGLEQRRDAVPAIFKSVKDLQESLGLNEDEIRNLDRLKPILQKYGATGLLEAIEERQQKEPGYVRLAAPDLAKVEFPGREGTRAASALKNELGMQAGTAKTELQTLERLLREQQYQEENYQRNLPMESAFADRATQYLSGLDLNDPTLFHRPDDRGGYTASLNRQLDPLLNQHVPKLEELSSSSSRLGAAGARPFPRPPTDVAPPFPPPPSDLAPPPPPPRTLTTGEQMRSSPPSQSHPALSPSIAKSSQQAELPMRRVASGEQLEPFVAPPPTYPAPPPPIAVSGQQAEPPARKLTTGEQMKLEASRASEGKRRSLDSTAIQAGLDKAGPNPPKPNQNQGLRNSQ